MAAIADIAEPALVAAREHEVMIKLQSTLGKFGEFWAHIAYFWLAWVEHNHFVKTKFTKLSKEISDPSNEMIEESEKKVAIIFSIFIRIPSNHSQALKEWSQSMSSFQIPTRKSFGYQHVKDHGEEGGGQVGEAGGMGD